MKTNFFIAAFACVLAIASALPGQQAPEPAGPDTTTAPIPDADEIDLPEPVDPAFERYVNLDLLTAAVVTRDPGLLTDAALQFAHAESILLRGHKQVAAEDLLLSAAQLAASRQDQKTLARISQAADRLGYAEVAAAVKLSSVSRSGQPSLSVDLATTSIEQFTAMKEALSDIATASSANDGAALEAVAKAVAATSLTDKQKSYLASQVDAVRKLLTDEPAQADVLSKLTDASRGGLLGGVLGGVGVGVGVGGFGGGYNYQQGYGTRYGQSHAATHSGTYGHAPATHGHTATTRVAPARPVATRTTRAVASRPGLPIANIRWYEEKVDSSGRTYWACRFFGDDQQTYYMQRYDNVRGRLVPTGQSKEGSYSYVQGSSHLRMDAGLNAKYPPYVLKFSLNGGKVDFDSASQSHTWRNRPPLPLQ